MGTGGTSWRGPAPRPALLTGALACALACAITAVAGCGGSDAPTSPRVTSATAATPPEDVCARIVAHWSREVLDDDTYGDYQSMGLSNKQYEILLDVVDAARAEQRREGAGAARRLIDRTARERCEERYRDGEPSEGPWS